MKRRGFMAAIAAALAGSILDPEKLLWVPRAKKIFAPKPDVFNLVHVQITSRITGKDRSWWNDSVVHADDMSAFCKSRCPTRSMKSVIHVMELPKTGNERFYKNPAAYKCGAEMTNTGAAWDSARKITVPSGRFNRYLVV